MGKTSISLIVLQLSILFVCFALGVVHLIHLQFVLPIPSVVNGTIMNETQVNIHLDDIFTSKESLNTLLWVFIIATIFTIAGFLLVATGAGSILPGFQWMSQNLDQVIFAIVVIVELAINLAMIQVYYALWDLSPLLAILTIGLFLIISIFIIVDWWRSPVT